jgi:hypothetical protein
MASSIYRAAASGLGNSAAYQVGGVPYVTASITTAVLGGAPYELTFPNVTKFVTITNTNTGANVPLRVGFSALGITGSVEAGASAPPPDGASDHYFTLDNGESYTGEWRVSRLYFLSGLEASATTLSVIAGLTGIPSGDLPYNWSGSAGVG